VVGVYVYQQYMPNIDLDDEGRPAPTFVAETIDGESFRLEDHRGEVVVLNVWATWCPPCRLEMPGFVDLQEAYRDEGVQFVGLSVDRGGREQVRSFVEEKGVNFPQIVDPTLAARHFPGNTVPRTYLIDKQGRIRYKHSGIILKWALDDALEMLVDEPTR
jgi:peroxiredoxin